MACSVGGALGACPSLCSAGMLRATECEMRVSVVCSLRTLSAHCVAVCTNIGDSTIILARFSFLLQHTIVIKWQVFALKAIVISKWFNRFALQAILELLNYLIVLIHYLQKCKHYIRLLIGWTQFEQVELALWLVGYKMLSLKVKAGTL